MEHVPEVRSVRTRERAALVLRDLRRQPPRAQRWQWWRRRRWRRLPCRRRRGLLGHGGEDLILLGRPRRQRQLLRPSPVERGADAEPSARGAGRCVPFVCNAISRYKWHGRRACPALCLYVNRLVLRGVASDWDTRFYKCGRDRGWVCVLCGAYIAFLSLASGFFNGNTITCVCGM